MVFTNLARLGIVSVAMLTLSSHALAEGWYVAAMAGAARQSDQSLRLESNPPFRQIAQFDGGALAGASVGYAFANGFSLEAEFAYQSVDRGNAIFPTISASTDGNYASTGFATNLRYHFDLFGSPKARSYVGVGVVALTEIDIDFEDNRSERSFSGSDTAAQLLAGVTYDIGDRWFLDLGWRMLRASAVELDGEGSNSGRIVGDYEPMAVSLGIGWRF